MNIFFSLLVQLAPFLLVEYWARKQSNSSTFLSYGLGAIASGLASFIGIKFFGLYAIGKYHMADGEKALFMSSFVFIAGLVAVVTHFAVYRKR